MNRRQCACLILLIVAGGFAAEAGAQTMPPIDDLIKKLTNDADPDGQTKARDALIGATLVAGKPAPPMFLLDYAGQLNGKIVTALQGKLSLRGRLNLAIVAARVAEKADNGALEKALTAMLNDPAEPVILWAMRGAQHVLKHVMKVNLGKGAPPLVLAIRNAVKGHPSGMIIEEAYLALGSVPDPLTIQELRQIWAARIEQYKLRIPDEPAAESRPVFILSDRAMWTNVFKSDGERTQLMQMISDQLSLAAQHADLLPVQAQEKHDQLVKVVQQCGAACWVIAHNQGNPSLERPANDVNRLNPLAMPPGVKVMPKIQDLSDEIRKAYPKVTPAPTIKPPPNK